MSKSIQFSIITVLVLLHLAYFAVNARRGEYSLGVDGQRYKILAEEYRGSKTLLGEKCTTVFWTPWYVVVAALHANRSAVFFFNLACFALVLLILRRICQAAGLGPNFTTLALLAYGFYWPTFDYCLFFHYEIFETLIFTAAVYVIAFHGEQLLSSLGKLSLFALLISLGLFVHSKSAGAFLLVLWFLIRERKRLQNPAVALVLFVLLSSTLPVLWGIRNKLVVHQWVFSSTSMGYNFYVGFNPIAQGTFTPQPPYPPLDKAFSMAIDFIRSHPGRSAWLLVLKTVKFWLPSTSQTFGPRGFVVQEWLLLPFFFVGILIALLKKHLDWLFGSMLFLIVYFTLFHAIFYVTIPRFRLPLIPFVVFFAVYALRGLFKNSPLEMRDR